MALLVGGALYVSYRRGRIAEVARESSAILPSPSGAKYTKLLMICFSVLLVSISARALLEWAPFVPYFPYLMWVHVAVLVLLGYGSWLLYRDTKRVGGLWIFVRGMPIWLAALALPVGLAGSSIFSSFAHSQNKTPDGQPVHSQSWLQEGDRHYVLLNRTVKVEITAAKYMEDHRQMYVGFSSAWIIFSYAALVMWQYIGRREGRGRAS